jgi:DNA helicase II / ATP-dependent DNA helicase PcrA
MTLRRSAVPAPTSTTGTDPIDADAAGHDAAGVVRAGVPTLSDLLDALDPEQRAAAEAPVGPVCILAGAGTGKTRAITARIARLVTTGAVEPDSVLAVTFTTRAAAELRGRLRALGAAGVQARTFHSAAHRQLSYFWPTVLGGRMPRVIDSKVSAVASAAGRLRLSLTRTELRDVTSEIEWARACLVTPEAYPSAAARAGRTPPRDPETIVRLMEGYERAKREAEVLDFDDLLLIMAGAIEEHRSVAAELRRRYRHFVVDEYQDVTPLQQRLLDAWLGDGDSLCVVGDPQQTIYSFTGASAGYLIDFERRFPSATVLQLVRDYRSTPQVVELANAVVGRTPRSTRGAAPLRLVAQRPDGPAPSWLEADDEPAEAAQVAARIRRLLDDGVPASEIAVLYRVNAQSEAYEAALTALRIPYLVRGGERFFERPEIREAIVLLRGAARSADVDRPAGLHAQVAEVMQAMRWRADAPPAGGSEAERWHNLAALVRLADDLATSHPEAGLGEFVDELVTRAADQHVPTVEGVTLASLHAAKGLEWDAVFLVGLVDGTLPLVHATSPAQVAEEQRLLYVGITRAREHLTLSWALARQEGGRRSRSRSRFLEGIAPEAQQKPAGRERTGGGRKSGRCRQCGASLSGAVAVQLGRCARCPSDADAGLLSRLRAWRSRQAEEQRQPAFVVLSDAALLAIAERRPGSARELARVPGIGKVKLDRYGEAVLELVRTS